MMSLRAASLSCLLPLLLLSAHRMPLPAASDSPHSDFLKCLSGSDEESSKVVFDRTDPSFTSVLNAYVRNLRYNTTSTPKPLLIVTPVNEPQVSAAVVCARNLGLHVKIRSGGHDYEGLSYVSQDPFIVLDMFNFRSIDVNVHEESAWVGAGALLGELYYKIWEASKVHGFPAGVCSTTGIGGHLSGGGYGNMLRKYGLSVDNIIDARIVNVDGKILDRRTMGEDLFWALRGGGAASFGVLLAYKVKIVPVPETVTVFRIEKTLEQNATDLVYNWQLVAPSTDADLFMRLLIQPVTRKGEKTIRASVVALFLGQADRLLSILNKELPELGLKNEDCKEMSWIESVLWWAFDNVTDPRVLLNREPEEINFLKRKSDYVQKPISKENLRSLWKKMIELGKAGLVFNPYGGRMSEIPASDTPFPHRKGNLFKVQHSINWDEAGPEAEKQYVGQLRELHSFMEPFVSSNPRSAFLNYRDLDIGINSDSSYSQGAVYGLKYFNGNFDRLVKVKTAVDPHNLLKCCVRKCRCSDQQMYGGIACRSIKGSDFRLCPIMLWRHNKFDLQEHDKKNEWTRTLLL